MSRGGVGFGRGAGVKIVGGVVILGLEVGEGSFFSVGGTACAETSWKLKHRSAARKNVRTFPFVFVKLRISLNVFIQIKAS